MDENNANKPKVERIDPKKFTGGLENLQKLKDLLGQVDQFGELLKGRAVKADETLNKLADFTQKFGDTITGFQKVVEMNQRLMEDMLRNAEKAWKDLNK